MCIRDSPYVTLLRRANSRYQFAAVGRKPRVAGILQLLWTGPANQPSVAAAPDESAHVIDGATRDVGQRAVAAEAHIRVVPLGDDAIHERNCLLYTSPSPRD